MSYECSTIEASTHSKKKNFQIILQYQTSTAVNAEGQVIKFSMADFKRDDTMKTLVLQNTTLISMSRYQVQLMLWKYLCYKLNITLISTNKHKAQLILWEYLCYKTNTTIISWVNTKCSWCYENICVTKQILPLYPHVNTKFSWCYEHISV
jgi:hypothetical protein